MINFKLISVLAAGFGVLSGSCLADAPPLVDTHAYVYVSAVNDMPTNNVVIVLDQGKNIGVEACIINANHPVPKTPTAIITLLASTDCWDTLPASGGNDLSTFSAKVFHQSKSDRFVIIKQETGWFSDSSPLVSGDTTAITFDRSSADQLTSVWTYLVAVDGMSPKVTTKNTTELRVYDTIIQYSPVPTQAINL